MPRYAGLRSIAQPLVADAPGLAGLEPSAEDFLLHWNLGVLFRAVFRMSMTLPIEHTTESDEWADIVWAYGLCLEHPFVQLPSVTYSKRYYRESTHAKDRSANGTSASVGLAGRIMRSNHRSWLGRMRPDRGGAAELPIHAQGRICLVGADRP